MAEFESFGFHMFLGVWGGLPKSSFIDFRRALASLHDSAWPSVGRVLKNQSVKLLTQELVSVNVIKVFKGQVSHDFCNF